MTAQARAQLQPLSNHRREVLHHSDNVRTSLALQDNAGRKEAKVEDRYLPPDVRGPELDELLWFEGRVGVEITPERWLAWDQGKG